MTQKAPRDLALITNSELLDADLRLLARVFFPRTSNHVQKPASGASLSVTAWPTPAGTWEVVSSYTDQDGVSNSRTEHWHPLGNLSPRQFEAGLRMAGRRTMIQAAGEAVGWTPPWGILLGVRPTKIVHALLDDGTSAEDIEQHLVSHYLLERNKAQLLLRVALNQRPFLTLDAQRRVSIYVGIPFCPSRCAYCTFPSYPLGFRPSWVRVFLAALEHEITIVGQAVKRLGLEVDSIYIGGGTPTSLPPNDLARVLGLVRKAFGSQRGDIEFTVEAGRPETIDRDRLLAIIAGGGTRVSCNPQSTNPGTLKAIGRAHTVEQFYAAFDLIRRVGNLLINTDVIVGLPGEGPEEVASTLRDIAELDPDNLTVHTLSLKRGSELREGEFGRPIRLTPQEAAETVALAAEVAQGMGMEPYYLYRQKDMVGGLENVGYAPPGKFCRYNVQVMEERQTIIGLGAGAASKLFHPNGWLLATPANPKDPPTYASRIAEVAEERAKQLELVFGR